ncbi:MAG: TolC family protein [Bacteroidota bacterium]
MKLLWSCIGILMVMNLVGQSDLNPELSYDQYIARVITYHPMVQQGNLTRAFGDAALLEARGGFDPKISTSLSQKQFKDDPYYSLFNAQLDIPTRTGIKVTTGYDRTSGINLNPENLDPNAGLVYAGVSVPLGAGLLYDERRAQLDRAKLTQDATLIEQIQLMNDLVLDAGVSYWQWWLDYQTYQIFERGAQNALELLAGVRDAAVVGDRAAIDTVEARIQYQNLLVERDQALLDYVTSTLQLSTYLWDANGQPQLIDESVRPSGPQDINQLGGPLDIIGDTMALVDNHPELQMNAVKLNQLDVDQRLAREFSKPRVDIKYNLLADAGSSFTSTITPRNYTWGLDIGFPLLFRKERAKIKMNEIYIADTQLDRDIKRLQIKTKIDASLAKWDGYRGQFSRYTTVLGDYQRMLEAERELFANGESSLFLINSRQAKYIEASLKWNDLQAKIMIQGLDTQYAAGRMLP